MALQFGFRLRQPCALDFFQDGGPFRLPAIRLGLQIVMHEVDVDGRDEFGDAAEATLAYDVVGQLPEEPFDQIQPRRAGRGEVNMHPGVLFQPLAHDRVLVGSVVVDDEMQGQLWGRLTMQFLQEGQPFDMSMLLRRRAQDFAIQVVQGGEQCDSAMPDVIVGPRTNVADSQGQVGLRALQCLALAFLVATEHQRPVWGIKVKPNYVPKFGLEVRIPGQLERPGEMGLNIVGRPNALDARRRDPHLPGHRTHAPASSVRRRLRGLRDQLVLLPVRNRRLAATARSVFEQSFDSVRRKPALPTYHRRPTDAKLGCRGDLRPSLSARKHDPRAANHPLRCRWRVDQSVQLAILGFTHLDGIDGTGHACTKSRE